MPMPMNDRKKREMVDRLVVGGKVNTDVQTQLEKTRAHIDGLLIETLTRHSDDLMREVCASILGERRSRKAIPALVRALADRSPHVRLDALWAIEKAAGLGVGELSSALLLNLDDWPEIQRRVRSWWSAVKNDSYFT